MADSIYMQVLWETLWSTTLWPLTSDMRFHAMALFGGYHLPLATFMAVIGAALGSMINYLSGWLVSILQTQNTTILSDEKYALWEKRAFWAMPLVGLLAWIHLLGPLIVAAGFFRVKPLLAAIAILAGQAAYYLFHYAAYTA